MIPNADKYKVLKQYFGYDCFRDGQEEIIDSLISGTDVLCIMPTGAGKSVCYQVPAMLFEGITIVISPLISLMEDQINALTQEGIAAAFINSSLSQEEYLTALYNMKSGVYKLVYVAPERLCDGGFLSACESVGISMVAVDEAHCVSQWGQNFRPGYLDIAPFIDSLPKRPVVGAFTATATDEVRRDISKLLRLCEPKVITTGFDRPNLFFSVIKLKPKKKKEYILSLVKEKRSVSGIIYCATRKSVEEVCSLLVGNGTAATRYHAGLSEAERKRNQEDFVYDRKTVMVATNAFGMGIDKSNVSYVIHFNMPKNIESYYQEAGRAGRDGEKAECILLYSPQDVQINKFLIQNSSPNPNLPSPEQYTVRQKELERLKFMTFYCTTTECLRTFMLRYFGEKAEKDCGNCSNCCGSVNTLDISVDAQKIICCVIRCGQNETEQIITDVLRGSKSHRVTDKGLQKLSTYGIMSEYKAERIHKTIAALTEQGILIPVGEERPILKTESTLCDEIVRHGRKVEMTVKFDYDESSEDGKKAVKTAKPKAAKAFAGEDKALFEKLREKRHELSVAEGVPAYVIFPDKALHDMCAKKPVTEKDFGSVSGVGELKLRKYGKDFIEVIRLHEGKGSGFKNIVGTDNSQKPWTRRENELLYKYSDDGLSPERMEALLGRTKAEIAERMKILGIE